MRVKHIFLASLLTVLILVAALTTIGYTKPQASISNFQGPQNQLWQINVGTGGTVGTIQANQVLGNPSANPSVTSDITKLPAGGSMYPSTFSLDANCAPGSPTGCSVPNTLPLLKGTTSLVSVCSNQGCQYAPNNVPSGTYNNAQPQPAASWTIKGASQPYTFPNGTAGYNTTYTNYELDLYTITWTQEVWEAAGYYGDPGPGAFSGYKSLTLWSKMPQSTPTYIQGNPNRFYFAPAAIWVSSVVWYNGASPTGSCSSAPCINSVPPQSFDVVSPTASNNPPFDICYAPSSTGCYATGSFATAIQGQLNKTLDPTVFAQNYYTHLNINSLGVYTQCAILCTSWTDFYPAVVLTIQAYIFGYGVWQVPLYTVSLPPPGNNIPNNPCIGALCGLINGWNWFTSGIANFIGFLQTPLGIILTYLTIGAIIVLLFIVFLIVFTVLNPGAGSIIGKIHLLGHRPYIRLWRMYG